MAIDVLNRQRLVRIDKQRIASLADATLRALNKPERALAVVFIRDPAMQNLNLKFRGKDEATDVLSFPLEYDSRVAADDNPRDGLARKYVGDVVVSTDTARRQAGEAGHSLDREIDELVIHGVLHLCGYDHETDNGEMNRLEVKLRHELLDQDA